MRSYPDAVERAVILVAVVIFAVLDAAVDAVVGTVFVKQFFHLCSYYQQQRHMTLTADKNSIIKMIRTMHKAVI